MHRVYSDGLGEWDVEKLWELSASLPVTEVDPESLGMKEKWVWDPSPSLGRFVDHMRRCLEADLSFPVIISAEGKVMDGHHRIARASLGGVQVRVVRFEVTPPPDRLCPRTHSAG